MTRDDFEKYVDSISPDPSFIKEWLDNSIEDFRLQIKNQAESWKMYRAIGDRSRMKSIQRNIEKLKECLDYMEQQKVAEPGKSTEGIQ